MARLRTSLVNAINATREQMAKNNVSVEEAAHNSALTFNENEQEILNKVKSYIEKEARKTGKVGRPRKNTSDSVESQNTGNGKAKKNISKKAQSTKKNTKIVADNENNKKDNIKMAPYVYSGEVSIKNMGVESKINVTINTNEVDFEKAKEYVLNTFYNNNMVVFISSRDFTKNLKNA
jgi:hypothetical protein